MQIFIHISATIEKVSKQDSSVRLPMVFENGGGVTITPVVTSSGVTNNSTRINSASSFGYQENSTTGQNLLSHLLRENNGTGKKIDLATIEPIRENRN